MKKNNPLVLVILDGWGYRPQTEGNAIALAAPPTFTYLHHTYPHTLLAASGRAVGLPSGYQGNSEVGHLTIGAGRIVLQPLTLINDAIADNSFFMIPTLEAFLEQVARTQGRLHLIGLLSDGGVHSHEAHLHALIKAAATHHVPSLFVHALTDGRDTLPRSAGTFFTRLDEVFIQNKLGTIATITGRFYGMDRDENWDRTRAFFDCLTTKSTKSGNSWRPVVEEAYNKGLSDEYIPPTQLDSQGVIRPGDAVIFFNFRPDRMRQICSLFLNTQLPVKKHKLANPPLSPVTQDHILSMTRYHHQFTNSILFAIPAIKDTLMDILEKEDKKIATFAETEKYAHVTYFFGGGKEQVRGNEKRFSSPSPQATSYAETPRMAADNITKEFMQALTTDVADFYLINYANADMVGHTGSIEAAIRAIACLDEQLKLLYEAVVLKKEGILIITSDHGNAEEMIDAQTKKPKTSHTTNPVPFIVVLPKKRSSLWDLSNNTVSLNNLHGLADIAPFILSLMHIPLPHSMERNPQK